jgi:hypothetical protein
MVFSMMQIRKQKRKCFLLKLIGRLPLKYILLMQLEKLNGLMNLK